ncbi:putative mfs transporter protein [Botrytis fragariae]|uniref:Putative mfs transporter protein n=1 Tax=Botrytis fragariae TaxID=1964551 RepID=A0A8H6ALW2_9HELO|nr:putative mfs transporter protein [Botrytis fragariae]KAF5869736.1 putative mfs transporter protein [Botrytis fragariae]
MPASSNFPISSSHEKQSSITAKKVSTAAIEVSTCQVDPSIEKSLLRKLDLHVVLPLMILFVLAFLDRVNIGNAKIQGMTQELKMVGNDFNVALMIFFPSYIFFEFPSNLILRRLPPSLWLTIIMTLWGIITVCQGLVRSQSALVGLRFLLGLFEAGFSPGAVYLISMYYKRYELQWRLSLFFAASILSGAFGGLFAYALAHMDGIGGYSGWRWIFIIEGLLTIVVALSFKFLGILVDWPETASFLTSSERETLIRRLKDDMGEDTQLNTLNKKSLKRILGDWKIYVGIFMYMGVVNTGYATSFFIPTIIQEMGYTAIGSQCLVIAYLTDRLQHRFGFTMAGVAVGIIGYAILLCQSHVSTGVKYMACFFITTGGYMTQPVTWAWVANNMAGHYKRSISTALQIGVGNIGGIVASNIFITNQAPKYPVGYGVSLGMLVMCGIMCTVFFFGLKRENGIRDRGGRDYRYREDGERRRKNIEEGKEEEGNWGDDWPGFRFVL